jgi:hypothetical protein
MVFALAVITFVLLSGRFVRGAAAFALLALITYCIGKMH